MLLRIQQTENFSVSFIENQFPRLWQFLLIKEFGRDDTGQDVENITHQELSEVINTTQYQLTRILRYFKEGILWGTNGVYSAFAN